MTKKKGSDIEAEVTKEHDYINMIFSVETIDLKKEIHIFLRLHLGYRTANF